MMIILAKQFAKFRGKTAHATDKRVRYIGEVIDGISSVKSYVWEIPFFKLIHSFRESECKNIGKSQFLRAINQGIMFSTPSLTSFATFLVFWALGGTLTIPIVFSTLSLLQVLRMTIGRQWTRSIETGSEAVASCIRIESFLSKMQSRSCKQLLSLSSEIPISVNFDTQASSKETFLVQSSLITDDDIVKIYRSSYYYGIDSNKTVLQNIEFSLKRGELLMVVGPVGSGKVRWLTIFCRLLL